MNSTSRQREIALARLHKMLDANQMVIDQLEASNAEIRERIRSYTEIEENRHEQ